MHMSDRHVRHQAIATGRGGHRGAVALAATLVLATFAACGGGSASHGGPDAGPNARGLPFPPGTRWMKVSETQRSTATAMMSSGPALRVQPTWKSDNLTVLAI